MLQRSATRDGQPLQAASPPAASASAAAVVVRTAVLSLAGLDFELSIY